MKRRQFLQACLIGATVALPRLPTLNLRQFVSVRKVFYLDEELHVVGTSLTATNKASFDMVKPWGAVVGVFVKQEIQELAIDEQPHDFSSNTNITANIKKTFHGWA